MRTISRGVTGAVLVAMSAIACTSESDTRSLPTGQTPGSGTTQSANAALAASLLNEKDMIVIYRDQMENMAGRSNLQARASVFAQTHAQLINELQAAKPRTATSLALVNAFTAKLSTTEVETLSLRSEVLAIVPNRMIRLPHLSKDSKRAGGGGRGGSATAAATPALCNTLEPEALQVTHTAYLDPSTPSAQTTLDGNGEKITGKGVTVAWLADGLDPNDPGFIRPDGTKVFTDYQDFSGDPATEPSGGAEAYGDAGSIAAQDKVYDITKFVNPAAKTSLGNGPCNIHVRGMAPGASLMGLKVFSNKGYTTTAGFVQAIEYAVSHGADVINESFGGNPVYDDTKDPISLANSAATRAGVTVVASTGDAGTAGTLGSPSTAKDVIAAGATTTFRAYQQTGDGIPFYNGFISSNISSISSGGFAQKRARTVDMVAPGDLGWSLCSKDLNAFTECGNYSDPDANNIAALPLQVFGGTSESSPLISGAAALVIQAYRSTHGGSDPSPATVKAILASSAHDIGAPADEQGAGLIDTLKATTLALALKDGNGNPAPKGSGLLSSPSSINFTAETYDIKGKEFDVTNTGSSFRVITPALEKLGGKIAGGSLTATIDTVNGPFYSNVVGAPRAYTSKTFNVPAGLDHLDASIAWKGTASELIAFELVDPTGKLAAYSIPQGAGQNYGHVDVVKPAAGQWKVFMRPGGAGYAGPPITFTWSGQKYVNAGIVFPPVAFLAPGQTGHFIAALATNGQAGDTAAAVRFGDDAGEIPITVRTLVPTGAQGGTFASTLTGGNGRGDFPTQTFAFDVPKGLEDVGVKLGVADAGYSLKAFLIDPNGKSVGSASTVDLDGAPATSLQINHADPEPGRYSLVVLDLGSGGTATSSPLTGAVEFDKVDIKAPTLPTNKSTKLSKAVGTYTYPVHIKNTGVAPRTYFADPRFKAVTQVELGGFDCSTNAPVSALPGACDYTLVPSRATAAVFLGQADASTIDFEAEWNAGGGPDLFSKGVAPGTVAAQIQTTEVPWGFWIMIGALKGPYGPAGAPSDNLQTDAFALMHDFDPAVSSATGNYWTDATFTGLTINPGQTKTLPVKFTIDSDAVTGTVVKGFISIDTVNVNDAADVSQEVVTLPYAYTVKN